MTGFTETRCAEVGRAHGICQSDCEDAKPSCHSGAYAMIVTHILSVANLVAARSIQLAALILVMLVPLLTAAQPAQALDCTFTSGEQPLDRFIAFEIIVDNNTSPATVTPRCAEVPGDANTEARGIGISFQIDASGDISDPWILKVATFTGNGNETESKDITPSLVEAGSSDTHSFANVNGSFLSATIASGTYTLTSTHEVGGSLDLTLTVKFTLPTPTPLSGLLVNITSAKVTGGFLDPPVVTLTTPVTTPTNNPNPQVDIDSTASGTVSYSGSCQGQVDNSTDNTAGVGDSTIILSKVDQGGALDDGTYDDCSITVTNDTSGESDPLLLPSFTIDTAAPTVEAVYASPKPVQDGDTVTLTVKFSEPMDQSLTPVLGAKHNGATFLPFDGGPTASRWLDAYTYSQSFTVQSTLISSNVGITVPTAFTDLAGNSLADVHTEPDVMDIATDITDPVVNSIEFQDSTGTAITEVTAGRSFKVAVTFDEPMDTSTTPTIVYHSGAGGWAFCPICRSTRRHPKAGARTA